MRPHILPWRLFLLDSTHTRGPPRLTHVVAIIRGGRVRFNVSIHYSLSTNTWNTFLYCGATTLLFLRSGTEKTLHIFIGQLAFTIQSKRLDLGSVGWAAYWKRSTRRLRHPFAKRPIESGDTGNQSTLRTRSERAIRCVSGWVGLGFRL